MVNYECEHAVGDYVEVIDYPLTGSMRSDDICKSKLVGRVVEVRFLISGSTMYILCITQMFEPKHISCAAAEIKPYVPYVP